jgi:sigma-B regulation protein RsbU (phosphoserine phosphatase)
LDISTPGLILGLVEKACLVIVIFYLLSRSKLFHSVFERKPNGWTQFILVIIFGILAIYGTYSGVKTSGAIANIRNLAPMMAGLLGGPWVGLGAGIIGGVHRYFMGGFTAVPCALGTVISGLAAGLLYMFFKGNVGIWKSTLFAFIMEAVDMAFILLVASPFDEALKLVNIIALPMILSDTIGIAIFAFMLSNMTGRTKTA